MLHYASILLYGLPALFVVSRVVAYITWYITTFKEAHRFVATTTIPSVTIYSHCSSVIFWLASTWTAPFIEALPFGWGHWVRYVKKDASWHYRGKLHQDELQSDVFWTVGPGGQQLYVSDADVISQIVHRWKDFSKKVVHYRTLAVFGPNVLTVEGSDWQRHRKITGPPFNERNSSLVFQKSVVQGQDMLDSFTHDVEGRQASPVVEDLMHWTMTVALHVISSAAFSLHMPWPTKSIASPVRPWETPQDNLAASEPKATQKHKMTFQHCVDAVMKYLPFIIFFPDWLLRKSPFEVMRNMQLSSDEFRSHMTELIDDNQKTLDSVDKDIKEDANIGNNDLLSNIIKASAADKKQALSNEEMIGNIFIFIVAGHETTANTLQTCLILLAMHPEVQKAVQHEIDSIWAAKKPGEVLVYKDDYPKMRLISALMLEGLRLYPPVVGIPKEVPKENIEGQTITYRNKPVFIPPGTDITIDVVSTQLNPLYWGEDSQDFRPTRWLMPPGYVAPPNTTNESPVHPNLLCPPKGAFMAFSTGFRGCLGRKFAQVEFCTLIAVLLKDYSIELVSEKGASFQQAQKQALDAMFDRRTEVAMRMQKAVKVRFVKRGNETFPPRE
ncbi:cytochrome P450 [Rhexocercosporidium sp. MPI-PUGE-AT-0058]|nr:cytochrome P450 [Rhexocercosporidium sp. MPI-PUGE-AT-0058]